MIPAPALKHSLTMCYTLSRMTRRVRNIVSLPLLTASQRPSPAARDGVYLPGGPR